MRNYKIWTQKEEEFLRIFYQKYGSAFCSEKLSRGKKAVVMRAMKLGIKSLRVKIRYAKEPFETVVKNSRNYKDVITKIGLKAVGGSYGTVKKYIKKYNIDISHFEDQRELKIQRLRDAVSKIKIPLSEILIENSSYSRYSLKIRLYSEGLKERRCELCGQGEVWQGKKMSLILDHENGINNDNRIENLRIVCSNCNATLETHCSKNYKTYTQVAISDNRIVLTEKYWRKKPKINRRKVIRPPYEILLSEIKSNGYVSTGRKYGVSDNAIRKWLKTYEQ